MSFDLYSFIHGEPCNSEELIQAEKALGHALPSELVGIYKTANGFRGPTNAAFLYPLFNSQPFNQETAVNITLYLREDSAQPEFWKRAIAFGDFGIGATWGINIDSGQVFEWWPEDGDKVTGLGISILDVWNEKKNWYEKSPNPSFKRDA